MSGSIPSWVRVGAKVVCVNGYGWQKGRTMSWWRFIRILLIGAPCAGCVYTIDGTGLGSETENPVIALRGFDGWYQVSNFRPLITKSQEQDVGLFVHHLDDVRVTERA